MSTALRLNPRISEQTYQMATDSNVYVFIVPINASKQQITQAVTEQYDVTVTKVNVTRIKGKAKSSMRRGRQPVKGLRSNYKKAYVTLKDGDSIPVFEEIE